MGNTQARVWTPLRLQRNPKLEHQCRTLAAPTPEQEKAESAAASTGFFLPTSVERFYNSRLISGVQFTPSCPLLWGHGPEVAFRGHVRLLRSGGLNGFTGHWGEVCDSKCSSFGSSRRPQYLDLHRIRDLWDRVFRSSGLLHFDVLCQIRESSSRQAPYLRWSDAAELNLDDRYSARRSVEVYLCNDRWHVPFVFSRLSLSFRAAIY